ncbi:hypothetical protein SDC9_62910 [bioreactor metagenome]|jgi:hypothetical protein|uniref:Uncharacterized protein n=2 Tax=root TaxID=1 RepID=R9CGZ0_9CLOT|nr:hypothetical protein [Clostridium sartagoforme]EOR26456.1 hypothetical protein A500_07771 [Clostridium sartagoforme AAU1]
MKREVQKIPVPLLIFGSDFNRHNTNIYIKNHTGYNLENSTIERTGTGGHPIKLGTIKAMSSDIAEEIYPSPTMEKSDLILNYVLNGENHSSVIHGNIVLTDIRPLVIDIIEENGELIFSATRITHEDISN